MNTAVKNGFKRFIDFNLDAEKEPEEQEEEEKPKKKEDFDYNVFFKLRDVNG